MHLDTYCIGLYYFHYYSNVPEHPVIRLINRKHISSSLFAIKALNMTYCAVGGHLGDHLGDHHGSMCNIIQSCIKTLANLVKFVSFSIYLCSYILSYGRTGHVLFCQNTSPTFRAFNN